jgi:hypothetical protein
MIGKTNPTQTTNSKYATTVLLTVTAVALLINYVETMVIPGLPSIQTDMATTANIASWITSALPSSAQPAHPYSENSATIMAKRKCFSSHSLSTLWASA